MGSDEYVRLEVADTGAGGKVVLIGYYTFEPQDEESSFRLVDDFLFRLSPHKVTYRSKKHEVLCSRYTFPLSLVGQRFRKSFLKLSLEVPNLAHAHMLEVQTLLERLEVAGSLSKSAESGTGQTDAPLEGKGVTIDETRGYWGHLAGH